jgi:excisionase family DNA binding protein
MPHNLIPSQTVCERLHIDRSTLSRWVADGKIVPAVKLPGKTGAFLFEPADVDALELAMSA